MRGLSFLLIEADESWSKVKEKQVDHIYVWLTIVWSESWNPCSECEAKDGDKVREYKF